MMNKSSISIVSSSAPATIQAASLSANTHSLSTTFEEDIAKKQTVSAGDKETDANPEMIESAVNLAANNERLNQPLLNAGIVRTLSSGMRHQKAFRSAHASFRLRMLQEQHMQPVPFQITTVVFIYNGKKRTIPGRK
uniref:Uncharacterized protein n=1 Tax=Setaria digitata TaxID=48799 RepID=A0A915PNV4_9BILA